MGEALRQLFSSRSTTYAILLKKNLMVLIIATNLDRESGGEQWRDPRSPQKAKAPVSRGFRKTKLD
jgi:hypothetical protein